MRIDMSEVKGQKAALEAQLTSLRGQLAAAKQSLQAAQSSSALKGQVKEAIDAKIGNHQLPLLTNYENALTLLASSYDELITRFQSITGETSDSAIINTDYLSELKSKAAGILTDSQMINSDANRIYSSISDIIPLSSPSLSAMTTAKSELDRLL
ncbi:T7SS effector LXG polymorphic toxin, partial [Streptococcus oriscaviae]